MEAIYHSKIGHQGRLGNQLFQFAALYSAARRAGCAYRIPRESLQPVNYLPANENFCLFDCFQIPNDCLCDASEMRGKPVFKAIPGPVDPAYFSIKPGTVMEGWFEDPVYFQGFENELRQLFIFKPEITNNAPEMVIGWDKTVCMHIRQGDRCVKLPLSYYQNAKALCRKQIDTPQFVAITDDRTWCKDNCGHWMDTWMYDTKGSAYRDLYLLSKAKNQILSASTFSWWGNWLNKSPGLVIAPVLTSTQLAAPLSWSEWYPRPGWTLVAS